MSDCRVAPGLDAKSGDHAGLSTHFAIWRRCLTTKPSLLNNQDLQWLHDPPFLPDPVPKYSASLLGESADHSLVEISSTCTTSIVV